MQESNILCQRDLAKSVDPILLGLQHLILNSKKAHVPDVFVFLLRLPKQGLVVVVNLYLSVPFP